MNIASTNRAQLPEANGLRQGRPALRGAFWRRLSRTGSGHCAAVKRELMEAGR